MHWIAQGEIRTAKAVCVGMAERVDLIRTVRPALLRKLAFQKDKRLATLAIHLLWFFFPEQKSLSSYMFTQCVSVYVRLPLNFSN